MKRNPSVDQVLQGCRVNQPCPMKLMSCVRWELILQRNLAKGKPLVTNQSSSIGFVYGGSLIGAYLRENRKRGIGEFSVNNSFKEFSNNNNAKLQEEIWRRYLKTLISFSFTEV